VKLRVCRIDGGKKGTNKESVVMRWCGCPVKAAKERVGPLRFFAGDATFNWGARKNGASHHARLIQSPVDPRITLLACVSLAG
jgi:hypothetical protein